MNRPKRLQSEPIVDAIFELRFTSKTSVANIFPGFLFAQLGGEKVERLPAADIPEAMRAGDANLRAMAVQKVYWGQFYVLVAAESIAIGCQLPYPGWAKFRPAIEKVLAVVDQLKLIENVHRYSLKYVDLLPTKGTGGPLSLLELDIRIGGHTLQSENYQLRAEIVRDKFLHVVQSIAHAQVMVVNMNAPRDGSILDIDSICNLSPATSFEEFLSRVGQLADEIHHANKVLFFECLRKQTVDSLGPVYE
jgi:uncharacterized protein (TIGR04255 family)